MATTSSGMECLGLSLEWEQDRDLRQRLRSDKKLVVHGEAEEFCSPSRVNAVANTMALRPALTRLAKTPKFQLPHLEDLKVEVQSVFEKCGLNPGEKQVYTESVALKRLAGFIKKGARRKEVTKD